MTTCLIVYRIWQQDRMSRSIISSSFRLAIVMRIIVESASLYLFNVLILIILYACNSNGQFVAQEALVPVCGELRHTNMFDNYQILMLFPICQGIAFALITVRLSLHTSTSVETTQNPGTKIEFTTMPGTAAVSHLTTTTDQPTVADLVVKQAVRINGDVHHALTSDD
ncbi:hypothetical protein OG21DRAFT_615171 [Imleria badia]|nr:hypothetical protein OG21DRAFT_615171 [Imleria badia]